MNINELPLWWKFLGRTLVLCTSFFTLQPIINSNNNKNNNSDNNNNNDNNNSNNSNNDDTIMIYWHFENNVLTSVWV